MGCVLSLLFAVVFLIYLLVLSFRRKDYLLVETIFLSLVVVGVLLLVHPAHAGPVDDRKQEGKTSFCLWRSGYVALGMEGRLAGMPLQFFEGSASGTGFHVDTTELSDSDVQFIESDVKYGYGLMDGYLKDHNKPVFNRAHIRQVLAEKCMQEENI